MTDYVELVGRLNELPISACREAAQAIATLTKERDEDYAIGLKLRQELAADNARLREALASIVTTTHRPNPTDPSRIDALAREAGHLPGCRVPESLGSCELLTSPIEEAREEAVLTLDVGIVTNRY